MLALAAGLTLALGVEDKSNNQSIAYVSTGFF